MEVTVYVNVKFTVLYLKEDLKYLILCTESNAIEHIQIANLELN